TRFCNCTGLDADGHYSSARDIAIVTAELMKHEVFRGWFLTWVDYLRGGETQLVNTNKLIRYYNGIIGGKTGTTDAAGCCLTACAERKNMKLVAVALGCEEDD
ncbi:MAG TPA: D-alanyl-D-alanine carboxypeptidase, partial [Ruminococcaceae bacterium]|nr:D-alanyl-D-alanine carboxypeptidase [Oscillospiraceae bacterium]